VRRKPLVLTCVLLAALAFVATAAATNGGVAPPSPESPNAQRISDAYYLILAVAAGIFLLVEVSLIVFIVRFRRGNRPREVEGPQIRGHTRLELIWTVIPVLILAGIASFVLYKLPGIKDVPRATAAGERLNIKVIAHQFYWEFRYPNGAVSIDELRAPFGRVVTVDITSHDVDHSWWIPELSGKFDAIPGQTNHTWFKAKRAGTFRGQCGEFCGVFHAAMTARVVVSSQADFDRWLARRDAELGRSIWTGACAKCHGLTGKGKYGPGITQNSLLTQRRGLEDLVRSGRDTSLPGVMPNVGEGWKKKELDALFAYVSKRVYKGGAAGGG
jgi:cytochrome c oxidase subunit 2